MSRVGSWTNELNSLIFHIESGPKLKKIRTRLDSNFDLEQSQILSRGWPAHEPIESSLLLFDSFVLSLSHLASSARFPCNFGACQNSQLYEIWQVLVVSGVFIITCNNCFLSNEYNLCRFFSSLVFVRCCLYFQNRISYELGRAGLSRFKCLHELSWVRLFLSK